MVERETLRIVHVFGAVLLLGNVTVTGFWAMFLYRARDRVPFRSVARAILWADLLFTVLGGSLLTFSGVQLALINDLRVIDTPWLLKGIGALGTTTVAWLAFLLPDQWRMEQLPSGDGAGLRRVFLRWCVVGWTSTAVLFWGLWHMVTKR